MGIDAEKLVKLVGGAGRLVGVKELLRVGGFNPGLKTELKRVLRDLVKEGRLERDGKRFGVKGEKHEKKSGPAWTGERAPKRRDDAPAVSAAPVKFVRAAERSSTSSVRGTRGVELPARGARGKGAEVRGGARGAPTAAEPRGRFRREAGPAFVTERALKTPAARSSRPPAGASAGRALPAGRGSREEAPRKGPNKGQSTHGQLVEGIIHHHPDGFAFVKPIVGQVSEDLFIPPAEARKALDHDHVLIEVQPGRGGRTSGRVVEVKSRTRQQVVGVYFENTRGAYVQPREVELGPIRVPPTQLARPGDAVRVRLGVGEGLFADRDHLTGEVAGSLGSPDDHSVEVLSVAYARGFHDEFPPEVMDEADGVSTDVSPEDAKSEKRRDVRSLPLVTIDGEDARDFDDAIYVEAHAKGWRLVVAIADVAHYVTEGAALDDEALRRATSVYLPGRVLPMLPERLSNGICSLKPDVDRLCMVADLVIDRQGTTLETDLYPAVMRSRARCTYTEVHQVLNGEHVPGRTELKDLFERANTLARTLTKMRLDRGAIDFDLPENRVVLDDKGLPSGMVQRERQESHRLVEECMLAANEAVARFFREQGLPTVNRYHGEPDEERLGTFLTLLGAYGIDVNAQDGELTSKELNRVLGKLDGHPEQRALHQLALRAMMQAVYSSGNTGHYGLGAEDYLHFTSPIRRYPDLLVHRLLKAHWGRRRKLSDDALDAEFDRLEVLSVQCSERERAAMHVEREVNALYACLLMKDRVGEEFGATIGGLSEHGFFVVLDEPPVEGFVKGESVFPDFELDPATYRLRFGDGREVRVGQKARVVLLSVNLQKKQMEFGPLSLDGADVDAPKQRPQRGGERPGKGRGSGREERPAARGGRPSRFSRPAERPPQRGSERPSQRASERPSSERPSERPSERRPERPVPARGERPERRTPQPPSAAVTPVKAKAEVAEEARPSTGFDARATLDRLWRERGAGKKPR